MKLDIQLQIMSCCKECFLKISLGANSDIEIVADPKRFNTNR